MRVRARACVLPSMEENKAEDVIVSVDPPPSIKEEEDGDMNPFLKIVQNPDGSFTRPNPLPLLPPNSSPSSAVLSKDVPLNPANGTWVRIFRPSPIQNQITALPIIVDFRGSGFGFTSVASEPHHKRYENIALHIPAIIVSVEYRLAPEHRLPAPYEDGVDAFLWVRDESTRDPWFDSADRSRCFLMGNSAGGNIAYHTALRVLPLQSPSLRLRGLILNEPGFGGVQKKESELKRRLDPIIPLTFLEYMWNIVLPAGADRDHEFCNPTTVGGYDDRVGQLPRCLVTGHGQDPLVDWQKEFVRMAERRGVEVVAFFDEDGTHGIEMTDPKKGQELLMYVKDFISSS